jgi:hypothetical protein
MKKFGILILSFLTIAIFQSCEKKSLLDTENPNGEEITLTETAIPIADRYFLNGAEVTKSDINFENDQLILLHGVMENKNDVMVFVTRSDFFNWADSKKDANINQLAQGIKNADAAREYAIKIGEDLNGEPSPAFLKYLEEKYGDDSKIGFGKLFQNFDRQGWSFLMGSIPIPRLKDEYNNATSSVEAIGRWYVLYDSTWWHGWLEAFGSTTMDWWNLTTANDKASSVWTI